jgi:hypothetical protein
VHPTLTVPCSACSLIDLSFFRRTSYSFQFVFYFLWINCLVSFTFLLSTVFRSSKTGGWPARCSCWWRGSWFTGGLLSPQASQHALISQLFVRSSPAAVVAGFL